MLVLSLSARHRDISDSRVKRLRAGCTYERSPCVRASDALTLNTCQPVCYLGSERGGSAIYGSPMVPVSVPQVTKCLLVLRVTRNSQNIH
ncbi:hypothetical protein F7725_010583 [Dissostichus mawsoni]|uniref:Uncharacterized protein n=1 Tax=Dissostichus mawsoni TaxID=36200 RepID=A0A7J5XNW2_DISMA|nr:hypothetical protein F7725_010583 [Dissostichus mawsoni]